MYSMLMAVSGEFVFLPPGLCISFVIIICISAGCVRNITDGNRPFVGAADGVKGGRITSDLLMNLWHRMLSLSLC